MLPVSGAVVGIDVGSSPVRRSSAVCVLEWTGERLWWTIRRFRAVPEERDAAINETIGERVLLAAAFDGPFRGALDEIGVYRAAERVLTSRVLRERIGKPGQSSTPVGRALNNATNDCVRSVLRHHVAPASHAGAVHRLAVVEAFPSSFMGVMLDGPDWPVVRRNNRSDVFFEQLTSEGRLSALLALLLPCRRATQAFDAVRNHDDRAALICAMTALGVAAGQYVAVGDGLGWIVLPPAASMAPWAREALQRKDLEEFVTFRPIQLAG
jgi:hypothetical protein